MTARAYLTTTLSAVLAVMLALTSAGGLVARAQEPAPGLVLDPLSIVTSEGGVSTAFSVSLATMPADDVTITLNGWDTSEGEVNPAGLTFTPETYLTGQQVTVIGINDDLDDGDVSYTITLTAASGDPNYEAKNGEVSVTNVDDDFASFAVGPASGNTIAEGSAEGISFSLTLGAQPAANVTILLASSAGGQVTFSTGPEVVFTPENWADLVTVTVLAVDDDIDETDLDFSITLTASSADPDFNGDSDSINGLTIEDNDTVGVTIQPGGSLIVTEAAGLGHTNSFTVRLDSEPVADVIFRAISTNETELLLDRESLTFTTGNWQVPQEITLTAVDDNIDDGDQIVTITTSMDSEGDPLYHTLNTVNVMVTVQDDEDVASVVALPHKYTVDEDNLLTVLEPGLLSTGSGTLCCGFHVQVSSVTPPINLNFTVNENGSFTYLPPMNFNGPVTFTYRAVSGSQVTNQAEVRVDVMAVNDAPIAQPDSYLTNAKTINITKPTWFSVNSPGLLFNDTDVDDGKSTLQVKLVSGPTKGTLRFNKSVTYDVNGNAIWQTCQGCFSYSPALGQPDTGENEPPVIFRYKTVDPGGEESESKIVSILIDTTPPAPPTWISHQNKATYTVYGNEVTLKVQPASGTARIWFYRYDALETPEPVYKYDLASPLTASPWQVTIDTSKLNLGLNHVFVTAYDAAGNPSDAAGDAARRYILLDRRLLPPRAYLPIARVLR